MKDHEKVAPQLVTIVADFETISEKTNEKLPRSGGNFGMDVISNLVCSCYSLVCYLNDEKIPGLPGDKVKLWY